MTILGVLTIWGNAISEPVFHPMDIQYEKLLQNELERREIKYQWLIARQIRITKSNKSHLLGVGTIIMKPSLDLESICRAKVMLVEGDITSASKPVQWSDTELDKKTEYIAYLGENIDLNDCGQLNDIDDYVELFMEEGRIKSADLLAIYKFAPNWIKNNLSELAQKRKIDPSYSKKFSFRNLKRIVYKQEKYNTVVITFNLASDGGFLDMQTHHDGYKLKLLDVSASIE
ncbi:MAG TPA: hypothetical protein VLB84_16410 [Bacteroidia bacterium]|nr:hypothetical protein [Bacteroidia bacterium]